jgi:hypothetical protein
MTANEMLYDFELLYDKIASEDSPGYTAEEISRFLTRAQYVFIDKYQKAEYNERRRRDLDNLTKTVDITSQATTQDTGKPNGTRYELPSDFMYAESEEATITSSNDCFDGKRIMILPKREDEYSLQVKNPFKKPQVNGSSYDWAWRMDFYDDSSGNKRVDLITDGSFTIGTYHLTYLKRPADIVPVVSGDSSTTTVSNCELNDTAHEEIVDIAVRIATGVTNPREYQVKLNEEKINN